MAGAVSLGWRYPGELVEAVLLRRYKRFLADVRLADGTEVTVHCPNPGRMTSCLEPDARCRLSHSTNPRRRLAWTLEQVRVGPTWILVNPMRSNDVVATAIAAQVVPELAGYPVLRRERPLGESRVDMVLEDAAGARAWVEVKTCTLARGDLGLFPDAVSKRGARHLRELTAVVGPGDRAVALFLVGRSDLTRVAPADDVDPVYGAALRAAVGSGVEVLAYRCDVRPDRLVLTERVPVVLPG